MTVLPYIPDRNPDYPENYGAKILYVNGKQEEFELAQHRLNESAGMLEFVTKDDLWSWVPLSSIQRLEYDKRLSKIVALKEKLSAKVGGQHGT